jgi:hypothetical protein
LNQVGQAFLPVLGEKEEGQTGMSVLLSSSIMLKYVAWQHRSQAKSH